MVEKGNKGRISENESFIPKEIFSRNQDYQRNNKMQRIYIAGCGMDKVCE